MSDSCGPAAERVTAFPGFSCENADPVITLRNPVDLSSWTQPVGNLPYVVLCFALATTSLVFALRRSHVANPLLVGRSTPNSPK